MTKSVRFTKMHGAGNDYIYVDAQKYDVPDPSAAAIAWSDRHTGIGSDGLVLIGKPYGGVDADFSMRIFNADGSEAKMCGNASRCIGKYLYERRLTDKTTIRLQTLSGVKTLKLHLAGCETPEAKVESVTVDMLAPSFHVPEQYDEAVGGVITVGSRTFHGTFVSMGNPHFVCFVDDIDTLDVARYGSAMEYATAFPERCNIEFAELKADGTIRTRVWERGSGITMACGTGACATAVVAAVTGRASRRSVIAMDGGTLHIEWNEADGHVYMTGPAAFVFDGEIEI
ncbi:diaminopimelate epimerase [Leyella stercorea]|uniref:diaminopimelate epimerase n=1 Tax=Leyella stercorea TaxID=363265 RepID=UPI0024323660|nr:diaminopimelate epimerase [Leyella stercorea]